MDLLRHISFVDCPGHDILMATMLNGAAVMDGAMLLVAANESCPQPQTSEHLAAVEIMQLRHLVILQNKIDLVSQTSAKQQFHDIREFVKGTMAEKAPVVPISAQLKYNIDAVVEYLVRKIPGEDVRDGVGHHDNATAAPVTLAGCKVVVMGAAVLLYMWEPFACDRRAASTAPDRLCFVCRPQGLPGTLCRRRA